MKICCQQFWASHTHTDRNSDGQFWASHGRTHGHTDTLLIFIPIDKPRSGLTPLNYGCYLIRLLLLMGSVKDL